MTSKFTGLTVAQICKAIDTLTPCMDDFVYVYDLVNDFYYISKLAVERFCLPSNQFHNVIENHAKFVYPADIPMLQQDLEDLVAGRKVFHDLLYRWVSVNNDPIWINCPHKSCAICYSRESHLLLNSRHVNKNMEEHDTKPPQTSLIQ